MSRRLDPTTQNEVVHADQLRLALTVSYGQWLLYNSTRAKPVAVRV